MYYSAVSWLKPLEGPSLRVAFAPLRSIRIERVDNAVVQPGRLPLPELHPGWSKSEAAPTGLRE